MIFIKSILHHAKTINSAIAVTTTLCKHISLTPGTDVSRAKMIKSFVYNAPNNQATVTFRHVPTGVYEVYAHTWEDNNAETFSLSMEGQVVLNNYNSGTKGTW